MACLVRQGDGGEWRLRLRDDRAADRLRDAGDEHEDLDNTAHDDRPDPEKERPAVAARLEDAALDGRIIRPRARLEDERDPKRLGEAARPARGGRVAAAAERLSLGLALTVLVSGHTTITTIISLKLTTGLL